MVSHLSPDPADDFRRLATGLYLLTPPTHNPSGHEHVGYALSAPNSVLLATSLSGVVLAALSYHASPEGVAVRMLGATGFLRGAGAVLLCALASEMPTSRFSLTVTSDSEDYYARLGWQPSCSRPDRWLWLEKEVLEAARLFDQSPLKLLYSELPAIAYNLVSLPDLEV